jgi:tellurite methyltransferase
VVVSVEAQPHLSAPAAWLTDNADLLPDRGRVLDVASGKGRNAMWLAERGLEVHAIDRSREAIELLREAGINATVMDLETDPVPELPGGFDAVIVFNYLHRPLMAAIKNAVKPGGRIFYETFTTRQAQRGHPRNPAFLLEEGELIASMAPLVILRSREGDIDGRFIASVVAERRG